MQDDDDEDRPYLIPTPPESETCDRCKKEVWVSTSNIPRESECKDKDCPINAKYRPSVGEFDPLPDHFFVIEFVKEEDE